MTTFLDLVPLHEDPKEKPKKGKPVEFEPRDLSELNVEEEILTNYNAAKNYLQNIPHGTPPNQVAQVMNTINTILSNLTKLQIEIYSSERVKRLEAMMVQAIKKAPKEAQEEFLDYYEALLKEQDKL